MSLLQKVIDKKIALGCADRYAALVDIALTVKLTGMFQTAKFFDVLVDESAEEFSLEFMPAYNAEVSYRY